MSLDETILYIDGQIGEMINKMINARAKHIDAINAILTKIASVQESALTSYTYRQGRTYDRMVKVETGAVSQFDIDKPTLKLNYIGDKMTLYHDSTEIQVPEVPIFVFELPAPSKTVHDIGIDLISRNLYVMLKPDANIEEPADVENAFGKYFKLSLNQHAIGHKDITFAVAKAVCLPTPFMWIKGFKYDEGFLFYRELTIDGSPYFFDIGVYPGVYVYDAKDIDGTLNQDVEQDGILFVATTDYPGDCWWVIFNNRFTKGVLTDSVYQRIVLMYNFQNRAMLYRIE